MTRRLQDSSLSSDAIIGISVGIVAGFLLLISIFVYFIRRKRNIGISMESFKLTYTFNSGRSQVTSIEDDIIKTTTNPHHISRRISAVDVSILSCLIDINYLPYLVYITCIC